MTKTSTWSTGVGQHPDHPGATPATGGWSNPLHLSALVLSPNAKPSSSGTRPESAAQSVRMAPFVVRQFAGEVDGKR
jgi:hypothetical protein